MLNPLKYLRQPKPSPSLPVKIAVLGPPKSGKTTGKTDKILHSKCPLSNMSSSNFLYFWSSSGTDVCSKIWLGAAVHWQCYAFGD